MTTENEIHTLSPTWTSPPKPNIPWTKLAGDLSAAALSATLVAPSIAVIDRAVVEKASHCHPIAAGLRTHTVSALARPHRFLSTRPFAIVWLLYAATYTVANTANTLGAEFHAAAAGTVAFLATSVVNVPLGLWKDLRFAQIYGTRSGTPADLAQKTAVAPLSRDVRAQVRVPRAAAAAFLVRDGLTIFGSFTLPGRVAAMAPDWLGDAHAKAAVAQIAVPVMSQLVATPVHLLGLSLFQRQSGMALRERVVRIRRDLLPTTGARCARIIPAFGFGVLVNNEVRGFLHEAARGS